MVAPQMTRWRHIIVLFTVIFVSLLFFYHLAFTDMILARGDTYTYFYPYWDARNVALRAGELPLWNPDIFMGVPLLANPQLGTLYPPNWLTIPFTAPDGIRISILLHIVWGALGTWMLFRRAVSEAWLPAFVAAFTFAFGGYVGGHVEQINQLQGISWLPWLLFLCYALFNSEKRLRYALLLAIAWALQLFSGHTQTVFMSGIALGILTLFPMIDRLDSWREYMRAKGVHLLMLAGVAIITVILALPQLLPTLELTGMSNRGDGLTAQEATAFSLPLHYVGRALLPSYDGQLFSEYVGYIGVIALGLAIIGALTKPTSTQAQSTRWVWIALALIGLLFAFGRYNPLYLLIADLPGFNLFRVPARWLALHSIGLAMLAGYGTLALQNKQLTRRIIAIAFALIGVLMLIGYFAPIDAVDIVGSAQPTRWTLLGWGVGLGLLGVLMWLSTRRDVSVWVLCLVVAELFLASRVLPHTELAPRDTYLGQRFTISQLLAFTDDSIVPPRTLAISARLFDVGDIGAVRERYTLLGMDNEAQATATTALKNQETLFPNLSMTWGIPSIDGFGGGLLPTVYYSQFTSLLLPDGSPRIQDGRIGETLSEPSCRGACVPEMRWLAYMDVQYLITDKNFDVVHEGIFYDTSLFEYWSAPPIEPDFIYDDVHVLCLTPPARGNVTNFDFQGTTYYRAVMSWETMTANFYALCDDLLAITVVENESSTFLQLMPPNIERVLSSDIKIYRLTTPTARARLVTEMAITPDNWEGHEAALMQLADNPQLTVVHDARENISTSGTVTITEYSDTNIRLQVDADTAGYLLLTDAYYPGWQATVNDIPTEVHRADAMFRAVQIPAGESEVVFSFVPRLWYRALWFGLFAWIGASVLLGWLFLRKA